MEEVNDFIVMTGIYLVNPRAGYMRQRRGKIVSLMNYVGRENVIITPTQTKLEEAVAVLESEPPDHLGIVGGDGTFSTVQTVLGELNPPTMVFNGGTMNNLHTCLNLPTNWLKYIERVVKGSAGLVTIDRTSVEYTTEKGLKRRIGCFFGVGLPHRYLQAYYGRGEPRKRGKLAVLKTTARLIGASLFSRSKREKLFLPSHDSITINDETIEDDYNVLMASTLPILTSGIYQFDLITPGTMHVIMGNLSLEEILKNFSAIRRHGSGLSAKHVYYNGKASRIVIDSPGPVDFVVDGELEQSSGYLEISLAEPVRIFK